MQSVHRLFRQWSVAREKSKERQEHIPWEMGKAEDPQRNLSGWGRGREKDQPQDSNPGIIGGKRLGSLTSSPILLLKKKRKNKFISQCVTNQSIHVFPSLSARHCTFQQVSEGRLNKAFYGPNGYAMLMNPNKGETDVHGCHCPGDMAVHMRQVLARPP